MNESHSAILNLKAQIKALTLKGNWFFFIGHRGVGKSSTVEALSRQFVNSVGLDLDQLLVYTYGTDVFNLLPEHESEFRKRELRQMLQAIEEQDQKNKNIFMSVGGGYIGAFPDAAEVIWLRRRTDADGRIFMDRPRLNPYLLPLEEFAERRKEREPRFKQSATIEVVLREGALGLKKLESNYFENLITHSPCHLGGFTTLPKLNSIAIPRWLQQTVRMCPNRIEFRDDLVRPTRALLEQIPREKVLIAFRTSAEHAFECLTCLQNEGVVFGENLESAYPIFDWPSEWGTCPRGSPALISWHGSFTQFSTVGRASLQQLLKKHPQAHAKAAVYTQSLAELQTLHQWQQEAPEQRSLLPMSSSGRWLWYRQFASRWQKVQFWQHGLDMVADQPTVLEWSVVKRQAPDATSWTAVLGEPVQHSWTPTYHEEFFYARKAYVTCVPITKTEFNLQAMQFLRSLGLSQAAVTAPLKREAFLLCDKKEPTAELHEACNTLDLQNGIYGAFTDPEGLAALVGDIPKGANVIVWGGGGLKSLLSSYIPDAQFVSARNGVLASNAGQEAYIEQGSCVDFLIWATGAFDGLQFPPQEWKIKTILDLNYSENSPGRQVAIEHKCRYVSGAEMFTAQARAQQVFWIHSRPEDVK